jgi:RNA polymerase sigma-70 factor (ECF subfamily)
MHQHGDEAFTELYRQHYGSVRAYVSACVGPSDVDDVVAETFLVAWRRRTEIPDDWTRGWLIGVARNNARNRNRSTRRAINFVDQLKLERPSEATTPDEALQAQQQIKNLRDALGTLRSSDQEVLALAGPFEMTLDEIGLALGITANAAGVRVHRARQRLRDAFAKRTSEGGAAA